MIAKTINGDMLKEAIKISFSGDKGIIKMYDPSVRVREMEDVYDNVFYKIKMFYNEADFFGVYEKEELIGYFVCKFGQLISFALNVKFRIRRYLRKYFALIKEKAGKPFFCYLYSNNVRGIKWLIKNDMIVDGETGSITRLVYV